MGVALILMSLKSKNKRYQTFNFEKKKMSFLSLNDCFDNTGYYSYLINYVFSHILKNY